jgi:hypothetical protein
MNSDEPQTHEPEEEQEPAVEAIAAQEEEQEPAVEASDDVEEQSPTNELTLEDAEDEDGVAADSVSLAPPEELGEASLQGLELKTLEEQRAEVELAQLLEDNVALAKLAQTVADLERQEQELRQKIAVLQETQSRILSEQLAKTQAAVERMVQEGLSELEQRKQALQISVEQLERRRERIRTEMRTSFAGVSQELAIRVQGFKDYLVGSLQDLASAAEQLELSPPSEPPKPAVEESRPPEKAPTPNLPNRDFKSKQGRFVRSLTNTERCRITMVRPGNCVAPLSRFTLNESPIGFLPKGVAVP